VRPIVPQSRVHEIRQRRSPQRPQLTHHQSQKRLPWCPQRSGIETSTLAHPELSEPQKCSGGGHPGTTQEQPLGRIRYPNLGFAGRPAFTESNAQIPPGRVILGKQHEEFEITR
jgi:hypothetical protein